jgi:uncharacterized membrane protein
MQRLIVLFVLVFKKLLILYETRQYRFQQITREQFPKKKKKKKNFHGTKGAVDQGGAVFKYQK